MHLQVSLRQRQLLQQKQEQVRQPPFFMKYLASMHFQVISLFYSGILLAMALFIAHPMHPRYAAIQKQGLIGGILGSGLGYAEVPVSDINTV